MKKTRDQYLERIDSFYRMKCQTSGVKPQNLRLSSEEDRLRKLIPIRTEAMTGFSYSYDKRKAGIGGEKFHLRQEKHTRHPKRGLNRVSAYSTHGCERYIKILEQIGYVRITAK